MANKAREPMTKPEEVIAWAEETKAGNGETFTMLKKEEQFLIAKFILAMRDHIKKLQSKPTEEEGCKPEAVQTQTPVAEVEEVADQPVLRQSNMEFCKANSIDMTRAYELYCVWRNIDPQNRTVFDDERKSWLKAAGFAFWLNLPHE